MSPKDLKSLDESRIGKRAHPGSLRRWFQRTRAQNDARRRAAALQRDIRLLRDIRRPDVSSKPPLWPYASAYYKRD